MSKHEQVIRYISELPIGTKISVRATANTLGISEGTAYKAIKHLGTLGMVSTIPRVGTVRIEKLEKRGMTPLSYAEVVGIVQGNLLAGKDGIHKKLNKFAIGAMQLDEAKRYITPGCLVIAGNREDIQRVALKKGCGVLITGGFVCSDSIKKLGDEKNLPIISSMYDSFTVATMINRAISENLIKNDIVLIEDIMKSDPYYLNVNDTIDDLKKLIEKTKHERYPVVDDNMNVLGIVTIKDIPIDGKGSIHISKIMSKEPITVIKNTTVAYTAHIMGWEGIDICPVVEGKKLIGIVSREDVIRALQYILRQPQIGEKLENLILKNFTCKIEGNNMHFSGKIIAEMLAQVGTASWSSLNMLLSTIGILALKYDDNNINVSVDSIVTYFIKPVQIDSVIDIYANILDMGRSFSKVEVCMYKKKKLIAKSLLSAKVLK